MPAKASKKKQASAEPTGHGNRTRRLRLPAYRPFRLRRIKYPEHLPSVWRLTAKTWRILIQHWRLLLGITLIYVFLNLVFVTGFTSSFDVKSAKSDLGAVFGGGTGQLAVAVALFASLLSTSGGGTDTAGGVYQVVFVIIACLATIWGLRQSLAGERVRVRDAFYKGMYPMVPFVLVACVVLLQTAPFLIGSWLYNTLTSNGIAVYFSEQIILAAIFVALTVISAYMLCGSLFALFIVTLPDMTPMKALRDARHLVRYRRGQVFRKLIYWPILLFVISLVVMLPVILVVPAVSPWVLSGLLSVALIITTVYMYVIYRELLA